MAYEMKPGQGSAWPNDKRTEKNSDGKTWYQVKIGKEVAAQGDSYSAAHKPFPSQDNHNKAKSNGFVDADEDIPF